MPLDHEVRLQSPRGVPISLADAKAHLGVSGGQDDRYIWALIELATLYAEAYLGRACRSTLFELWTDAFVRTQTIEREVETIDEVAYMRGGDYVVVSPTIYELTRTTWAAELVLARSEKWPTDMDPVPENGVRISYTARIMTDLATAESTILRHISFMFGDRASYTLVTTPHRVETDVNEDAVVRGAGDAGDIDSGLDPVKRP